MKGRCSGLAAIILIAMAYLSGGCATLPATAKEKGIVAWSYQTQISQTHEAGPNAPQLIVGDLQTGPPEIDASVGHNALKAFPILSLMGKPVTANNSIYPLPSQGVGQWELERILAEELGKAGLFGKVTQGESGKGYLLAGTVDFKTNYYMHHSGMGSILYVFSLVGVLFLPDASMEVLCNAHFDLLAPDGKTVVFTKDYQGRSKYFTGIVYNNLSRHETAYGGEVFPQVVAQLVEDLKALPEMAWVEGTTESAALP